MAAALERDNLGEARVPNEYWKAKKEQILQNADFGLNPIDAIEAASSGKESFSNSIILACRQQYWSTWQAFSLGFLFFTLGLFICTAMFVFHYKAIYYNLQSNVASKFKWMAVGMMVTSWLGYLQTRGPSICNPEKKEVRDAGMAGKRCISDRMCSGKIEATNGLCTHRNHHGFRQILHASGRVGSVLLFIVFLILEQSTGSTATAEEGFVSGVFGAGTGMIWAYIVS